MSAFPGTPRTVSGGVVLVDIDTSQVQRVISLQYNPDTVTRSLQVQGVTGEQPDHLDQLRLKGAPIETYKIDAEIDATDQLEFPDDNPTTVQYGILPQLAALETIVYPPSAQVLANYQQSLAGTMEVFPLTAPLQLFVWSTSRVLPVRITDFSITEEFFDPNLNPIRAKVSLGMRVLNTNDIGFDNKGGSLFMIHHQQKEKLAALIKGSIASLGLRGLP